MLCTWITLIIASCSKSDEDQLANLTFEKNEYTVMNNVSYSLMVKSGNGDYSIIIEDSDIISASIIPSGYGYDSYINILGLKNGKTSLTVKDNLSGQNIKLNITVVDAYVSIYIGQCKGFVEINDATAKKTIEEDILEKSLIQDKNVLVLKKNEKKDFYLLSRDGSNRSKLEYKGTYRFADRYHLTLQYIQEENTIKEQEFLLSPTEGGFLYISNFFDLIESRSTREMSDSGPLFLYMSQDVITEYKVNYPTLTSAILEVRGSVFSPYDFTLDIE